MSENRWDQLVDEGGEGDAFTELRNALPDVFYAFDRGLSLRRWNDRLRACTGYSDEELASMHPLAFVPEEEHEPVMAAIESVLEHGEMRTVEADLVTKTGERIPYEFNGSPVADEDGTVVGFAGTGRDISERKRRERELSEYEMLFETIDDGVYIIDDEQRFVAVNEAYASMVGYDRERMLGAQASLVITEETAERAGELAIEIRDGEREFATLEFDLVRSDGSRLPVETRFTYFSDEERTAVVGVTRDVSDRKEREHELRHQRDELETLNRLNVVIRELVRSLAGAASRDEVEQIVCTHLTDSDPYRSAWIGERGRRGGEIEVRAEAGIDDGFRSVVEAETESGDWEQPASVALRTGDLQVINDVSAAGFPDAVVEALESTSVRSGIAVPLSHARTTYGVLAICATREDVFGPRERAGFEALGELIGFVIDAVESKRLLFADRVIELEFRVSDPSSFFVRLTDRFDGECVLEEMVPARDGLLLQYARVKGIPADVVLEQAKAADSIEHVRLVGDDLFEVVAAGESPALTLSRQGASITRAIARDGDARIVAELPPDTDVRSIVEAFESKFPDSELVSKREIEQPSPSVEEFREGLDESLTDRQRTALQSAYVAGYFDWPRDSTAEEVASALGVTSATLHQHLRKAERKLLAAYFE